MRLLASARGERPWFTSLLHAMRVVTAGLVALDGVTALAASGPVLREGPAPVAGVLLALAGIVAMVVLLVRDVDALRWHTVAVAVVLGGLTLALVATQHAGASSPLWWPTRYLTATLMFVVVASRSRWRAALLGAVGVFHAGMRAVELAPADAGIGLVRQLAGELGLLAFTAGVMFVIMETLLGAAALTDDAHAAAVREKRRIALADATQRSAQEVERFVHDEVLHTLRLIAMDRRDVSPVSAVAAATRLERLLHARPAVPAGGDTFTERMANAIAEFGLAVEFSTDEAVSVPPDVESALLLATLEALRNVERHANVSVARVSVRREGLTVVVEVEDDGVGFDPESVGSRTGVRSSIHERVREVGGEASIRSRPGHGTTVRLAWAAGRPPISPRFATSMGYGALAEIYPRASLITVPYFAFTLWNAAWLSPDLAAPWAGWASALSLTAITSALLLGTLRHGPRRWMAFLLPALAWTTTALNGWALPEGVSNPYLFWSGTASLAVAVALTMFHHPALIVVSGLGSTALVAAFSVLRAGGDLAGSAFLGTITQPAISVGAYLAVRLVFDSLSWEVFRTGEESARELADARARAEFAATLTERLRRGRDVVAAFVADVAAGRLDPVDDAVRARADAIERTLRDQMLTHTRTTLPEAADRMRALGHSVVLRVPESAPAPPQEVGAGALRLLATMTPNGARADVTLTVLPLADAWRVALTVLSRDPLVLAEVRDHDLSGWTIARADDFVRLTRHVPSLLDTI